jgi:signal transduction histidine kinase/ActR/RegA family two-component response regulator
MALTLGLRVGPSTIASTANIIECITMVYLTRRLCGQNLNFSDSRRLFTFLFGAVLPACLLGAAIVEVAGFLLHTRIVIPNVGGTWLVNHALGAAAVIPAMTVIANRRRFRAIERPPLEFGAVLAIVALMLVVLFSGRFPVSLLMLTFPMLMLMAFRYGPFGAALGSLLITLISSAQFGLGAFKMPDSGTDVHGAVHELQFMFAVNVLSTLPVAGAVASYARMRNLLARRTLTAREARRRADDAAKAKGEFLANMSHEIRTPLNGVIGLADALARTELNPEQREMLKMVLDSGKALTGLLSDALDLTRADSGALELTDEPFDVRDAIGSSAFLFETIARDKKLAFQVDFDVCAPGVVVGDALRIRQVISNLISNAVKFTSEGSVSVEVSLMPTQDGMMTLQAVVRDTGAGFDETVKARLFKRFEQGDSSVTRRYGGSGLGLSIAQRLAEMMHGRISCDSTPGVGSVFAFSVALPAGAAIAVADEPVVVELLPERAISVLLAEDHPVNRRVVQAMLGDAVDLTMAANGQEALEAFHSHSFDLILMDTQMPVMDGLTAIRAIRETERTTGRSRTPIISLTADAMPKQVEASLAAGADMHLAKPITGEGLFGAIEACLAGDPQPRQAAVA